MTAANAKDSDTTTTTTTPSLARNARRRGKFLCRHTTTIFTPSLAQNAPKRAQALVFGVALCPHHHLLSTKISYTYISLFIEASHMIL